MSLANANTMSRFGEKQGGDTDPKELFLKKFAGEVLTTFETESVMKDYAQTRTIANGKSAQFPVTGIALAKYHTAGESVIETNGYLNSFAHTEKVIDIEGLLTSSAMIYNLDEAMNHYDVRSIYSTEIGRALAKEFDKAVAQTIILAARSASNFTSGGAETAFNANANSVSVTGTTPTGSVLVEGVLAGLLKLDERDVPSEGRVIACRPAVYWKLVEALTKGDFKVPYTGETGVFESGKVAIIGGAKVVKSNNIPSTDLSSDSNTRSNRQANYSLTQALVFHPSATGCVKLLDVAVESEYQIERQGTLMVGKYAVGHGILRPECAYEIKATAAA
jgi:hypothetical protein